MTDLCKVLMERDNLSEEEAELEIAEAREMLMERLDNDEDPEEFLMDHFGLEDDYLLDLL